MTENNDLGTNLNFLGPWKSKFTLNVTGDADRQRTNERTFTITDTFQFLLANLNRADETGVLYCDGQMAWAITFIPLPEIGVVKTVKFFSWLCSAAVGRQGSRVPMAPTMVDNLKLPRPSIFPERQGRVFAHRLRFPARRCIADRFGKNVRVTVGLAVLPSGAADAGSLRGFLFPGAGIAGRVPGLASRAPGS